MSGLNEWLCPHHNDLDGHRHRHLGSVFVIELFDDEHHNHDNYRHHQVTDVGRGDLDEDFLESLDKEQSL